MNDVKRLLAAFETGELLRPSADVLNVVDLANAVATLAGAEAIKLTSGANTIANLVGPSDHLVFIVVDGLGMNLVEAMNGDAFMPKHVVTDLRTVFSSTTPTVLTTLATGEWPNRHAVVGWYTYLSEIGAVTTIIRFVRRSDNVPLTELGLTAEQVFPSPSLVPHLSRDTLSFRPWEYVDSVYSIYSGGGSARLGYNTLGEAVDAIITRVAASDRPTYSYLYTPHVDVACHAYGTGHSLVQAAVLELDRELERLASELAGHARIIVSADHGLLDADESEIHWIDVSDALTEYLTRELSGDSRVVYFDVREGAETEFHRLFKERFDDRFLLFSIDEAERLGLFGPGLLSSTSTQRLGNLMAISRGADVLLYRWYNSVGVSPRLVSYHSGLTAAEMRVPLIVA